MRFRRSTIAMSVLMALAFTGAPPAYSQEERIIDGAAVGRLEIAGAPEMCRQRVRSFTMFVSNNDPADVDDTVYLIDLADGTVLNSYPAPAANPEGLAAQLVVGDPGTLTLLVSDDDPTDANDLIYKISTAGGGWTVEESWPASSETGSLSPRALVELKTWTQQEPPLPYDTRCPIPPAAWNAVVPNVWIANGSTLCLIDVADGSNVRSIPAPCGSPQGLEIGFTPLDTTELWVGCDDTDTIYLVDTSDGSVIRSIPAPAPHLSGLAYFRVDGTLPLNVSDLAFEIGQGENASDTLEVLGQNMAFDHRIYPECAEGIPAVSEWGLVVIALLVLAVGTIGLRAGRPAARG